MSKRELTGRAKAVKDEFIRLRGFWVDEYDEMAMLCPDFLEKLVATGSAMARSSGLSPIMFNFVAIAVDAAITHLYELGTRLHMRTALQLGATREQLVELIQIISFMGMQSHLTALPIIVDLLDEGSEFKKKAKRAPSERDIELKKIFTKCLGNWSSSHDIMVALSDDYLPAYMEQLSIPCANGALTPQERALIIFATNVSVTHLNGRAIHESAAAALAAGCSGEELVDVVRVASMLGLQSCITSFPILIEELENFANIAPASASSDEKV